MKRTWTERFTSRPFLAAVVAAVGGFVSSYYGIPTEAIAAFSTPLIAFILGESYRDGKAAAGREPTVADALKSEAVQAAMQRMLAEQVNQKLRELGISLNSARVADTVPDLETAARRAVAEPPMNAQAQTAADLLVTSWEEAEAT